MFPLALALLALTAGGCVAAVEPTDVATIGVRGRVVDAESCASSAGCRGLAGMVVSLRSAPELAQSAPTGEDGTFVLERVPAGYRHDLIVRAHERATAIVAPTINPMVIGPDDDEDLFGVELYVVPRDPDSLLVALRGEGLDLVLGGGYVGQIVRIEGERASAASGVRAAVFPEHPLRYVGVLPRFVSGEPVLQPADATSTGAFGSFVVEARGSTDPVAFVALQDGWEYDLIVGPLEPGFVTYAIHRGRPR